MLLTRRLQLSHLQHIHAAAIKHIAYSIRYGIATVTMTEKDSVELGASTNPSVTTAGVFPLDLGFLGLVWVSGYFSGKSVFFHKGA